MQKNDGSSSSSSLDYHRRRLPPGYRFKPTDQELLLIYLHQKIYHSVTVIEDIRDVDLYKCDPHMLTEKYSPAGDREWYFFSPRDRKYRNGSRPNRCVSTGGFWKAVAIETEVKHQGKIIGYKKNLSFHYGKPKDGAVKTKWMMQEYVANYCRPWTTTITHENDAKLDEWVLCRLYENERKVKEELIEQTVGMNVIPPQYYTNGIDVNDDVSACMMVGENLSLNPPPSPSQFNHQYLDWDILSNNIDVQTIYDNSPSLDLDPDHLLPASDCPTINHASHINLDDGVQCRAYDINCDKSGAALEGINTQIYQTVNDDDIFANPEFYNGSGSMMVAEDLSLNDFPLNTPPYWSSTDDSDFPFF